VVVAAIEGEASQVGGQDSEGGEEMKVLNLYKTAEGWGLFRASDKKRRG